MFNSTILEVSLGLVFVFLLYSLLATSIQEAIATGLSFRARMLRNAITERMLANISADNRWMSLWKGIKEFFLEIGKMIAGERKKPDSEKKIGDWFFEHPLIKNYGSSRIFSMPSYIPRENFSTVLMDILKQEFDLRKEEIALHNYNVAVSRGLAPEHLQPLEQQDDMAKIRELIAYYGRYYLTSDAPPPHSVIDKDTWKILHMLLHRSKFHLEGFTESLEMWFEDTMGRVSGWYKRQTQTILFFIGILLAMAFNVDTIGIAERLSRDQSAREQLVGLAIQSADKYKDDPRVKKTITRNGEIVFDSTRSDSAVNYAVYLEYKHRLDSIIRSHQSEADTLNNIIAMGWGHYGKEGEKTGFFYKTGYVLKQTFGHGKKLAGFLITAFAIGLGAPFWFDLLNKLVKIRATGRKEGPNYSRNEKENPPPNLKTTNIRAASEDEAVG